MECRLELVFADGVFALFQTYPQLGQDFLLGLARLRGISFSASMYKATPVPRKRLGVWGRLCALSVPVLLFPGLFIENQGAR